MTLIDLDYDLADVSSEFEPLPVAQYVCKLTEAELLQSSTGKPMLKIVWEVCEGEFEGRKLYDNVVLEVAWKVKQYAEAAGMASGTSFDSSDLIGTEAILAVKQREYEGQMRNQINQIKAI